VNPFERYRFTDESLAVMARWVLSQKRCRNQGFVLDGFPKTVKQATLVFGTSNDISLPELADPTTASGGEGDGEASAEDGVSATSPFLEDPSVALNAVDEKLFPNVCVVLSAPRTLLVSRARMEESKDVTVEVPAHDSVANTLRRLNLYDTHHTDAPCLPSGSVITWMKSVLTAAAEGAAAEGPNPYAIPPRAATVIEIESGRLHGALESESLEHLETIIGAPHFYRPTPEDIIGSAVEEEVRHETIRLETLRAEEARERDVQRQREAALVEHQRHQRRFITVEKEKSEAAAVMSHLNMHTYLLELIVPTLTEAMERTAVLRPEDPIDTLAEILFHHAQRQTI